MTQPDQDRAESAGEWLARLKDDGAAWAAEFRKTALALGYSDMDEGWLISWFANAIEITEVVRRKRWDAAHERARAQGEPVAAARSAAEEMRERCAVEADKRGAATTADAIRAFALPGEEA